ncbi:MAG: chorismate lyase [Coxiellaceae bacterium]|nr:MAG: chorismate lyase [Coxiellaceae bacterium]
MPIISIPNIVKSSVLPLKWQRTTILCKTKIPFQLNEWLFEKGSLTKRLQQAAEKQLDVQVIFTGWQQPRYDDCQLLQLSRRPVWVRQTLLQVDGRPWILARSVVPSETLKGRGQILKKLGNRPLGMVLYKDRHLQRGQIEIAQLNKTNPDYQLAGQMFPQITAHLWARRSVFLFITNHCLLVRFLPSVWQGA